MRSFFLLCATLCLALGACADGVDSAVAGNPFAGELNSGLVTVSDGPEIPDANVCDEEHSLCGHILVPADLEGTPRSLVVSLYTSVPPVGPPNAVIAQIDGPSIKAGEQYPVRINPMLEKGEYFIWINLYMEDGGQWMPIHGVDYSGVSAAMVVFDGAPFEFDPIDMALASGW